MIVQTNINFIYNTKKIKINNIDKKKHERNIKNNLYNKSYNIVVGIE